MQSVFSLRQIYKTFFINKNRLINNQSYPNDKLFSRVCIENPISFHCSRHTFGSSYELGVPILVIRDLLGHRDLKTTQIYAKVADPLKNSEMDKWNT